MTQQYKNKTTGEIVEAPFPLPKSVKSALLCFFIYGVAVVPDDGDYSTFHAEYEPVVKEDE